MSSSTAAQPNGRGYGTSTTTSAENLREVYVSRKRSSSSSSSSGSSSSSSSSTTATSTPPDQQHEHDDHDRKHRPSRFCDNTVVTSKYSFFSFLPISLFEQFRRVANMYFLFISILMLIGTYTTLFDTPMSPWSTLVVLTLVVSVSMVRSALEDNKRHVADAETNTRLVLRMLPNSSEFEEIRWCDVKVGDIILQHNNKEIPADCVLLASSEPNGIAYIETSNIDGEANLKLKESARTSSSKGSAWSNPEQFHEQVSSLYITCEQPSSAIHSFSGILITPKKKEVPLGPSSLLLRGSSLRNTKWVLALVVFTGRETKLVMNSRAAPFKVSSIERTMNNIVLVILFAQLLLTSISVIFYVVWKNAHYDELIYLCYNYEDSTNDVYRNDCSSEEIYSDGSFFFTFFILYSNFLPISMYVTVEICNYFQAFFIDNDINLFDEVSNTPATARTSNMNSDLGMVEYVFSDKTGTLTDNVMRFRRCSIAGIVYGDAPKELASGPKEETTKKRPLIVGRPLEEIAKQSNKNIKDSSPSSTTAIADFVLIMAVCHTMIIEEDSGSFQSESPDELALVQAAADLGWKFIGRLPGRVLLENVATGEGVSYDLLATVPFDSTRKRMSVVVRKPNHGGIVVYCKGADNVMYDRASKFVDLVDVGASSSAAGGGSSPTPKDIMNTHLEAFASDGLRTLVLAKKDLSQQQYEEFAEKWKAVERAVVGRDELIAQAAALIECELEVVGATAIEDKLQDGVPQTIVDLGNAGVKVWVLTGDKMETAINIGYSARLLSAKMVLIRLQQSDGGDNSSIKKKLQALVNTFQRVAEDETDMYRIWVQMQRSINDIIFGQEVEKKKRSRKKSRSNPSSVAVEEEQEKEKLLDDSPLLLRPPKSPSLDQLTSEHLALIVDGETLLKIFGDTETEKLFLSLATICKSVIACRVSPEQKRLVVRLVKKGISPRPVTLSIGDGANDVAMIQEAQIGVGISGKEGRQAVNSSDFAIAQFRFLKRLMVVHGRTDYRRTCKVVLYSFYKNIALTLVLFAFTFYSGYSGQSLFDDYIHSAYNLILAWPVIAFGVFDRDISEETLEKYNMLYVSGRKNMDLNIPAIVMDMLQALLEATICYGIPYYCYLDPADVWGSSGYNEGIWVFGTTVYTVLVISMFLRAALLTYTWTYITHICFWGSVVLYVIFLVSYQYYYTISYNYYGVTNEMAGHPTFWWLCLIVPSASGLLELSIQMIKREFFPTVVDIGVEVDSGLGFFDKLLPKVASDGEEDDGSHYSGSGVGSSGEETTAVEAEASLRYSNLLGGKQMYKLDWKSLQAMLSSLQPNEQEKLGMQNAENGPVDSSFNFDHVGTTISNALLFPLTLVASLTSSAAPSEGSSVLSGGAGGDDGLGGAARDAGDVSPPPSPSP